MPVFMMNSAPEVRAKFDAPDFVENNEEMLKEEFSNYFQVNIKDFIFRSCTLLFVLLTVC